MTLPYTLADPTALIKEENIMKKRTIIALVLALMMCVSFLSACGSPAAPSGGGGSTPSGGGGSTPSGGGSTPGGDANAPGGDAANQDPVRVGVLGPFTGPVAEYGVAVRDGVMLFIEQYNAAGGLPNGRLIETFDWDDEHDPVLALTGYNWLLDQGVTAIIGGVTSGPTMAVVPDGFADNMPMITASATAEGVTFDAENNVVYTNIFRSCFIDPFQGEKMADFAYTVLGAKTAAVIFNTGVDYSIGLKDAFLEKAAAIGLEIVANESYSNEAVDYQSQLTNIAAKNPDVLFCPDYYQVIALLSMQARNAGLTATLLGADGWDTVVDVMADPTPIEGSFYCSGYSVEDDTPMVQEFLRAFVARFGHEPNMFAAQGYDAAMILVAALEIAEASGHATGSDAYRTAVIEAMRATNMEAVTGHITYDRFNNPVKSAVIIEIRDGVAKFWGKF